MSFSYIPGSAIRRSGSAIFLCVWHYRIAEKFHNNDGDSSYGRCLRFRVQSERLLWMLRPEQVTARWPDLVSGMTPVSVLWLAHSIRLTGTSFFVYVIGSKARYRVMGQCVKSSQWYDRKAVTCVSVWIRSCRMYANEAKRFVYSHESTCTGKFHVHADTCPVTYISAKIANFAMIYLWKHIIWGEPLENSDVD